MDEKYTLYLDASGDPSLSPTSNTPVAIIPNAPNGLVKIL